MNGTALYAGVDIGGTGIKAAIVDGQGFPIARMEASTSLEGCDAVCSQVARLIGEMAASIGIGRQEIKGIGIGVPGYVNPARGIVHESPNLGWKDVHLKEAMASRAEWPVVVENDANAAAMGELWRGAGAGVRDLAMVTLGTGVGCGIVLEGRIVHGSDGFAGELGHMKMRPRDGGMCVCGKRGCLETTSSGIAIVRSAESAARGDSSSRLHEAVCRGGRLSVKQVFDAAKQGDELAGGVIREAALYLGIALADLANLLNLRKIVIGGGIAAAGDYYLGLIRDSFDEFALDIVRSRITLASAELGNDAGFTGAALLVKQAIDPYN